MNASSHLRLGRLVILNSVQALAMVSMLLLGWRVFGQVNSGSDGHDGALSPTLGPGIPPPPFVIDMADHPDGIYHYTSVNIQAGIKVQFKRNASGTPVVWLVQGSCVINGEVDVSGTDGRDSIGGVGGPGGFGGGNGGVSASAGQGPGGGALGGYAYSASYGAPAIPWGADTTGLGTVYGNQFLLPFLGGSGGGGASDGAAAGGGGGAILIAASQDIQINGMIVARGGSSQFQLIPFENPSAGGAGSGGGVRLVGTRILGAGQIDTSGGYAGVGGVGRGGFGRVRFDALDVGFGGRVLGVFSQGFQPIIIPPPNQAVSLVIQSVGGIAVPINPTGALLTPDVTVPGSQQNPIPIIVRCANIPLNTEITVEVKPANGSAISVVGNNNAGTQAASTATISVNIPRGGGTIQAKATSGIAGTLGASLNRSQKYRSYADTGLTSDGERFAKVEITAMIGRSLQIAYLSESGKRYPFPNR